MNHFNKKNYKGSHEMYNARSYLGTDKIQTYKNIPVLGESGMFYVLIYFLVSNSRYTKYNET
jgi:hypothetical protein